MEFLSHLSCFSKGIPRKQPSTIIEELCHRFSFAEIRSVTNNFNETLGIELAGLTTVYKGYLKNGTTAVAVKRFEERPFYGVSEFKNEVQFLCQLHHPNLMSLIGFCIEKKELVLVHEYAHMANRSLHDHLHDRNILNVDPLPWKRRLEICIGTARGLHYLHAGAKRTIFHRGVEPSNILLDQNWVPKLSNFGLCLKGSLSMSKPKPLTKVRHAGTVGFMAPECCYLSNTLTEKCDVFSFGMVLLVVVCAKHPHSIMDQLKNQVVVDNGENEHSQGSSFLPSQVYNLVQEGKVDEIVDPFLMGKIAPECWKMFMDVAERCLLFEPNERPAMGEVEVELEHALASQEEADYTNPRGDYSLSSTMITPQPENAN